MKQYVDYDRTAELGVIKYLCAHPELYHQLDNAIADFTWEPFQCVLGTFRTCVEKGLPLDGWTLASELQHYNGLDRRHYNLLRDMLLHPPKPDGDLEQMSNNVRSLALHRDVRDFVQAWLDRAKTKPVHTPELITELLTYLLNIADRWTGQEEMNPAALARQWYNQADIPPRTLGYPSLDELCSGGLTPQTVMVIGYPSGSGKSTLAANIIANQVRNKEPVVFFTPETSKRVAATWINAILSGVPWYKVHHKDRFESAVEEQLSMEWWNEMGKYLLINELTTDLHAVHSIAVALQAKVGKPPTIVIDILDAIDLPEANRQGEWRRQEKIVDTSTNIAKKMFNTVVFTAQVDDKTEKALSENNMPPRNFAFRGSKGIRNKADICLIGCRHNGKVSPNKWLDLDKDNRIVITCGKNRMDGSRMWRQAELEFDDATKRLTEVCP